MAHIEPTAARHVPANNTRQGWGIVVAVVVITLAANFAAWTIHRNTYRPFIHPAATIPNSSSAGH